MTAPSCSTALKLYDTAEALDSSMSRLQRLSSMKPLRLHVRLGVDSRHADQQVRGAVVLPNGTGKNVRVLVFCKGRQGARLLRLPALTMSALRI